MPRAINGSIREAFNHALTDTQSPGIVDATEATELMSTALEVNASHAWLCGLIPSHRGQKDIKRLIADNDDKFAPAARANLLAFAKSGKVFGPNDVDAPPRTIMDWQSSKSTWHCHWFPMKESKAGGGDPINNLFAPGGALDKYDQAFGTDSREYELGRNFRAHDSDKTDANWAGHCNNASELACMIDPPKKGVTFNGVHFTKNDIAGLLVKISDRISTRVDFKGKRYYGPTDDPNDPNPQTFLATLKKWTKDDKPFVLDIDREDAVWNYPYDKAKVIESNKAPAGFDPSTVPDDSGFTRFYRFELAGTDFDAQARNYEGWMHTAPDGSVTSGWVAGEDPKVNPDFMWRPHKTPGAWRGPGRTNPKVTAENVWSIYSQSIA